MKPPKIAALFRALLVAVVCLSLSGCVYLRLLQVRNQLAKFDRYFEADTRDGLKLTFKEPVLLDQDFEEFFKWQPESRQKSNTVEKWHFKWLKEPTTADASRPPYAVELDLYFTDRKLSKIVAPESFFATFMPKKTTLSMIRAMGGAKVDEKNRSASVRDIPGLSVDGLPTQAELLAQVGAPVEIAGDASAPKWRYRFAPASPHQKLGQGGIDVTFTFDAPHGRARRLNGVSAGVSINVDFGPAPENTPAPTTSSPGEKSP